MIIYFFFIALSLARLFILLTSNRYVAQYNDMPSPLSNAEKLAESSRREEEMRRERERDDAAKSYHERESRGPMTSQQRKGND